jgi:hypothetical protein
MVYPRDPPEEYEWPWCEEYTALMGMETNVLMEEETKARNEYWEAWRKSGKRPKYPRSACSRCPMMARCPDGISVITTARSEAAMAEYENSYPAAHVNGGRF